MVSGCAVDILFLEPHRDGLAGRDGLRAGLMTGSFAAVKRNAFATGHERISSFVVRRLVKGEFGQVFLAFDEALVRPVAIKVPRPERVSQPEDVEAYLDEARVLASLDHPHIVPVHDAGRTENGLCFACG
jgi:hypothetical protein